MFATKRQQQLHKNIIEQKEKEKQRKEKEKESESSSSSSSSEEEEDEEEEEDYTSDSDSDYSQSSSSDIDMSSGEEYHPKNKNGIRGGRTSTRGRGGGGGVASTRTTPPKPKNTSAKKRVPSSSTTSSPPHLSSTSSSTSPTLEDSSQPKRRTVIDLIKEIFTKSQKASTYHNQQVQAMLKIDEGLGTKEKRQEKYKEMITLIDSSLVLQEATSVNTFYKFIASLAKELYKIDEERFNNDVGFEFDQHSFTHLLLNRILVSMESKDKTIRYRSCQLLSEILVGFSDQKLSIDQDLFNALTKSAVRRLNDKSPYVRQAAVGASVRIQQPLEPNDIITKKYLAILSYDPSENVRAEVLKTMKIPPASLPEILERTKDIEKKVREATYIFLGVKCKLKKISPSNKRIEIINRGLTDKENSVRESCRKTVLKWLDDINDDIERFLLYMDVSNHEKQCEHLIRTLYSNNKFSQCDFIQVAEKHELTDEVVLSWRVYLDYLFEKDLQKNHQDEEYEFKIDKILPSSKLLLELIDTYKEKHFILGQICLILCHADIEEKHLKPLETHFSNLLISFDYDLKYKKIFLSAFRKIYESRSTLWRDELIKIFPELTDPVEKDENDNRNIYQLHGLTVLIDLLRYSQYDPMLFDFEGVIINMVRDRDPLVRKKALKCFGLLSILDIEGKMFGKLIILLKAIEIEVDIVKSSALKVCFDVILAKPPETYFEFCKKFVDQLENTRFFINNPKLQLKCIEGICKLYFNNHIHSQKIFDKLQLVYYTKFDTHSVLNQSKRILELFYRYYVHKRKANMEIFIKSFTPTLTHFLLYYKCQTMFEKKAILEKIVSNFLEYIEPKHPDQIKVIKAFKDRLLFELLKLIIAHSKTNEKTEYLCSSLKLFSNKLPEDTLDLMKVRYHLIEIKKTPHAKRAMDNIRDFEETINKAIATLNLEEDEEEYQAVIGEIAEYEDYLLQLKTYHDNEMEQDNVPDEEENDNQVENEKDESENYSPLTATTSAATTTPTKSPKRKQDDLADDSDGGDGEGEGEVEEETTTSKTNTTPSKVTTNEMSTNKESNPFKKYKTTTIVVTTPHQGSNEEERNGEEQEEEDHQQQQEHKQKQNQKPSTCILM